jgi:hypothetical protein
MNVIFTAASTERWYRHNSPRCLFQFRESQVDFARDDCGKDRDEKKFGVASSLFAGGGKARFSQASHVALTEVV